MPGEGKFGVRVHPSQKLLMQQETTMFFRKQSQQMKPARDHSRSGKGPARLLFRPRLEALENRYMPSTINTWISTGVDTLWNDPSNWSLGHVPTSTEVANFNSQSFTPCLIDNSAQDNA